MASQTYLLNTSVSYPKALGMALIAKAIPTADVVAQGHHNLVYGCTRKWMGCLIVLIRAAMTPSHGPRTSPKNLGLRLAVRCVAPTKLAFNNILSGCFRPFRWCHVQVLSTPWLVLATFVKPLECRAPSQDIRILRPGKDWTPEDTAGFPERHHNNYLT